ncbi:MAG TPA: ABC transporter permease [Pyrinomonadaceae bacterium]
MPMREEVGLFTSAPEGPSAPRPGGDRAAPAASDDPLIRIRASDSGGLIDPGELWAHRELCYLLIWRDLKVRYKQTVLGPAWVVLQPAAMTLVFTVFLGMLGRIPSDGVPYAPFAYAGLLLWTLLSNAVSSSAHSLVGSAPLITKIYFPRLLVPLATVAVRLVDFAVASVLLLVLLLAYGIAPTWGLLVFPALVLELALLALALGLWSAALNVKYRDVGTLLPVALQFWMFASPVVYPASLVPEKWRWLYALNPLVGIIEGARASLFGRAFDWGSIAASVVVTLLLTACAAYSFRRAEESFADFI